MKSALLLTTYNWPEALALVIKSIEQQTLVPHEVIIADDGSKADTKALIDDFRQRSRFNIIHVWHKDEGFRRSSILNKAIAKSKSDYIIQTDGDCILHKDFIKDHVNCAIKNAYLYGSRVSIKEGALHKLFEKQIIDFNFASPEIKQRTRSLRIPFLANGYSAKPILSNKLRGCNLSFWREDFIAINGYNEDMIGWGREDTELITRMMNTGVFGKRIRYAGIVYHIWHKTTKRDRLNLNDDILANTIENNRKWCENGINQYLNNQSTSSR